MHLHFLFSLMINKARVAIFFFHGRQWPTCLTQSIPCLPMSCQHREPGGCFPNVLRALQNILSKFVCCRNRTTYEHFKLKLCSCAQSHALGTRTKFQLKILTINVISGIVYFRDIMLESSRNVSETSHDMVMVNGYVSGWDHSSSKNWCIEIKFNFTPLACMDHYNGHLCYKVFLCVTDESSKWGNIYV